MADLITSEVLWVGLAPDTSDDFTTHPRPWVDLEYGGVTHKTADGEVEIDRHFGLTRQTGLRENGLFVPGTEVENNRQVTLGCVACNDIVGDRLSLAADVEYVIIGSDGQPTTISRQDFLIRTMAFNLALMELEGESVNDIHGLPNGTKCGPFDADTGQFNGGVLDISTYVAPCKYPGEKMEQYMPGLLGGKHGRLINAAGGRKNALGIRGMAARVYRPGQVKPGDRFKFVMPDTPEPQ